MATIADGGGPGQIIDTVVDGNGSGTGTGTVEDGNDVLTVQQALAVQPVRADSRTLHLESMDGSVVIPLNVDADRVLLPGATGLGLSPLSVVTATTPGMRGSWLQEIDVLEREVFLPLEFASEQSHAEFLANIAELRALIAQWDSVTIGQTGTFRLVANSVFGERVLDVIYKSGWEGNWGAGNSGVSWEKVPLTLVAVDPYWRDREPTEIEYSATPGATFLGTGDGTNPWPRRITPSVVVGSDMEIAVDGEVPVWPEIEINGPAASAIVQYPGTDVELRSGVPDGSTLWLVSDPRARSATLDSAIAWELISMGATMAPLLPGVNAVSVILATTGEGTSLIVRWTPGYESAW
ncbi:hypothetical protein [Curtobacterium sp. MCBD17_028]|uniref:hypothetical protein n=1 Tax=Curtobacterium sp. MCBD17_028 TaxID=2175670 RepID=UPI000DA9BEF0|nr:hypothetical protein [Curtobacterium sp. MCBD17_028]PZE23853.1 hypothetical protein DEI86_13485 [Curtobacterium sp. MCBD17_028]